MERIFCSFIRKEVPADWTTFSSIMMEPRSLAPKYRESCPISSPWATHEPWIFLKLSRKIRLSAKVLRYSWPKTGGVGKSFISFCWNVQGMNAVKPAVLSWRWRILSR